jgi:predicted dehydrogenase
MTAATQSPCRIGIVGAGNVSKLHLQGIARHPDRARVAALCDPDEAMRTARGAECDDPEMYDDLAEMIARAELDAAIVCTPTNVRKKVILPLIEAKVPILCEKPFAETSVEAAEIERAARAAGVPVAVNQNFRRNFPFYIARDILARGELGRPLHVTQCAGNLRRDKGWRLDRKRYVMTVMSVHWFDAYRYMLDDEAETVYCRAVNSPATPGGDDTAVSAVLTFRSGAMVSFSESFSSFAKPKACTVDCERGGLVISQKAVREIRPDGDPIEHENLLDRADGSFALLDDLLRAAAEGGEPEASASDNLGTMRILEAAYRSIAEGRVVQLEEIQ